MQKKVFGNNERLILHEIYLPKGTIQLVVFEFSANLDILSILSMNVFESVSQKI